MVGVECLRARERPVISGERRDGCEPPNLFSGLGFSVVVYWCASTGELQEPPIIVEGIDCPAWKSLNGKDGENHAGSDTELETLSSDRKSLNFGFSEQLPSLTIFKNKKNNGCYISITIKGHTRSDLKIVSFTRVSYMFCNILQTWGTIRQLRMLLLRSWRWQTIMDCEMLSSPDNPQFLFTILASMDWSTVSESTFFFFCVFFFVFCFFPWPSWPCLLVEVLTIRAKFLEPFVQWSQLRLHLLHNKCFYLLLRRYGPGLISLFNGISNFVGYLMPKQSL